MQFNSTYKSKFNLNFEVRPIKKLFQNALGNTSKEEIDSFEIKIYRGEDRARPIKVAILQNYAIVPSIIDQAEKNISIKNCEPMTKVLWCLFGCFLGYAITRPKRFRAELGRLVCEMISKEIDGILELEDEKLEKEKQKKHQLNSSNDSSEKKISEKVTQLEQQLGTLVADQPLPLSDGTSTQTRQFQAQQDKESPSSVLIGIVKSPQTVPTPSS